MNQACFNFTKCICIVFLLIQLLIYLYSVITSGSRHIIYRQDDQLSVDDRRNVSFTKYLLIQLTVMQLLHGVFFVWAIVKDKTIGILLMVICTLIQLVAKLTVQKPFVPEEIFITQFVVDFIILFFTLTLIPKQTKGFNYRMIFRNTFFA